MGIRKRFNKVFGLGDKIEEERRRYVNRVNQSIFSVIDRKKADYFEYGTLFNHICFEIGVDADTFPWENVGDYLYESYLPPKINVLTRNGFAESNLVLCFLYQHFEDEARRWLAQKIQDILLQATCDIGVRWKDGFFYPSGAKELDSGLIEEPLDWLDGYPSEKKDFLKALKSFGEGSWGDVIKNCYSGVEGISRKILSNSRTLDNNKEELLRTIGLSDGWNAILNNFINYAHDYRHASEQRYRSSKEETEAYLYMSGLIIRLVIERKPT